MLMGMLMMAHFRKGSKKVYDHTYLPIKVNTRVSFIEIKFMEKESLNFQMGINMKEILQITNFQEREFIHLLLE